MKYKAVIFDLDGTLLDTLDDLADSMNRVLVEKGFPAHQKEAYRYFLGNGARKLVSRALPCGEEALTGECLENFKADYGKSWNVKTRPYEGICELLDALSALEIKIAVLSNKVHQFTNLCIREYFSGQDFSMVLGQREGVPIKPDPTGALEISRSLGLDAGECIYMGDSDVDMATAVNSNMLPVGALWGFRSREELMQSGARKVISHPQELLQLF